MRIYKMTATFGKLEHQTLTLEPGLNILTAPNEWGKSTWCAFLMAMFYGFDTRAKSTRGSLADKDRYAPWSGSPMEGRIDLNWQGRDITLERRTSRRVPLGEFRAYETNSGLAVKELTAANCGQMLLGVEQSVFRRAGFLRHRTLPVTQDEALRRRLNALVTTGDESGAADQLADQLRKLKNRCRYNKIGLLPQAEAERDALAKTLEELDSLEDQCRKLKLRQGEVKQWLSALTNHRQALEYRASEENADRVAQAREARDQAEADLRQREQAISELPTREETEKKLRELRSFREAWNAIQMEQRLLPQEPEKPVLPAPFTGMEPEAARAMADLDAQRYAALAGSRVPGVLLVLGAAGILTAALLVAMMVYIPGAVAGAVALAAIVWGLMERRSGAIAREELERKYGSGDYTRWADPVAEYEKQLMAYTEASRICQESSGDLQVRLMVIQKRREALCGDREPDAVLEDWQRTLKTWDDYHAARREAQRAHDYLQTLEAMARPAEKPSFQDDLTYSEADTARLLSDCAAQQQRLQNRLGQYQGRIDALGERAALQQKLDRKNRRIAALEDTYAALTIALETLADARVELQRRFAPKIAQRAQTLMARLTGGRYRIVTLGEDFSLQAQAGEETTTRDALWRSDGTVDQLYLALRLAVAEALTPDAPLILDDALIRFDDERLKAAVKLLDELASDRQILCFTCQDRESRAAGELARK